MDEEMTTTITLINIKKYQGKTLKGEDGKAMKSYDCIKFYQKLYGDKFVYIGRAVKGFKLVNGQLQRDTIPDSKFCNPYHIPKDGTREEVIEKFGRGILYNKALDSICELRDKILRCYCAPQACHGNVLIEILNGNSEKYGLRPTSLCM